MQHFALHHRIAWLLLNACVTILNVSFHCSQLTKGHAVPENNATIAAVRKRVVPAFVVQCKLTSQAEPWNLR